MKNIVKRIFYGGFSIYLIVILAIVLRHPQNNLLPDRIFLYTLVWIGILCVIKYLFSTVEKKLYQKGLNVDKISRTGFVFYVLFYGVALFFVSLLLRSHPITDYESVYNTAYNLATRQPVEDWSYFSMWTNNLGPLSILTFLMKTAVFCGFKDPYYFVLTLNVFHVVAVMVSLYYLAGKIISSNPLQKCSIQWFTVACFTLWTPVWASTNAFYSDQLSFGGGIIAIALLSYGCSTQRFQKWIYIILAGFIWGICTCAKATAAIGVVALLIVTILSKQYKMRWKELSLLAVTFILSIAFLALYAKTYPSVEDEHRLKMPTEYWFAMGLKGDGTYAENLQLVEGCYYAQNVDERQAFCRNTIRENWTNLFDRDHIVKKVSVIFGTGELSPTSHIYPYIETVLWHWVYWEGDYFWKYSCLSTAFFFAVLCMLLAGTLREVFKPHGEESADVVFLIYLTLFGIFLFIMLWEAQNKQLYNHIPWMTMGMVIGLKSLADCVMNAGKKISEGQVLSHGGTGTRKEK